MSTNLSVRSSPPVSPTNTQPPIFTLIDRRNAQPEPFNLGESKETNPAVEASEGGGIYDGLLADDVVGYWQEDTQRGYTVAEMILLKKSEDKAAKDTVQDLSGQLRKLKAEFLAIEPMPDNFEVQQNNVTVEEIAVAVKDLPKLHHRIKIPKLFNFDTEVNVWDQGRSEFVVEPITLTVPEINKQGDWESLKLQPYFPTYSALNYDHGVLSASVELVAAPDIAANSLPKELGRLAYGELRGIAASSYFGAYGLPGQMLRFRQVREVHIWAKQKPSKFSFQRLRGSYVDENIRLKKEMEREISMGDLSGEALKALVKRIAVVKERIKVRGEITDHFTSYLKAIDRVFPLMNPPLSASKQRFLITAKSFLELEDDWRGYWNGQPPFHLIEFDKTTNAGPLFPKMKHVDSGPSELYVANMMLNDLVSEFEAGEFWRRWNYIRLYQVKPKPEVYKRPVEGPTKVRNIYAASTFAGVPAKAIFGLTYKMSPNFLENPGSKHMLGFSPFHGGMTNLFKYFIHSRYKEDSSGRTMVHTLVFADNLYLFFKTRNSATQRYELHVISLDGAKMEGVQNLDELYLEVLRLYQHLGGAVSVKEKNLRIDPAYANYLLEVLPVLIMGGVGMIGMEQLEVPGMPSGVLGTGYWNTQKMGLLSSDLDGNMFNPQDFSKSTIDSHDSVLGRIQEEHRVKLTWENHSVFDLGTSAQSELQYQSLLNNHKNTVVRLDLLGYDVYFFVDPVSGVAEPLPTLMKERLMNSMLFHKFGYYKKLKPSDEIFRLMNILVFKVLYMIGGYAHPELSLILRHEIKKSIADLGIQVNLTPTDDMRKYLKKFLEMYMDVSMVPTMMSTILQPSVPSVASVLSVLGQERAYDGPYGPVQLKTLRQFIYKGGWRELTPELSMGEVVDFLRSGGDDLKEKYGAAYARTFLGPDADLRKRTLTQSSAQRYRAAYGGTEPDKPKQLVGASPAFPSTSTRTIGTVSAWRQPSLPKPVEASPDETGTTWSHIVQGKRPEKEMKAKAVKEPEPLPSTTKPLVATPEQTASAVHLLGSLLDKPAIDVVVSQPPDWAGLSASEKGEKGVLDKAYKDLYQSALAQYILSAYKKMVLKRSIAPGLRTLTELKSGVIRLTLHVKKGSDAVSIPGTISVKQSGVTIKVGSLDPG